MRSIATVFVLVVCFLGCGSPNPLSDRVELLTGIESCYAGGQSPSYAGILVPDPEYGTRIDGKGPVMWTVGYTGRRLPSGDIQVLNTSGDVVATTGKAYAISPAPPQRAETQRRLDSIGAIAAPDCYAWDFEEVAPQP